MATKPKLNKDGSVRKTPGRKPRITPEHGYAFPSLSMRQMEIVLRCIEECMHDPVITIDGEPISPNEWVTLLRALFRGEIG